MKFKIKALDHQEFKSLFDFSDNELKEKGIKRMIVDAKPGYPCRVSLEDAEIGEEVLLIPYKHHKTTSPYQATGPVFVRKGVKTKLLDINEIPIMLNHRLLSFRGYDKDGIMVEAQTQSGSDTQNIVEQIFENKEVEYIHIHNSSPGCYNCEVNRVV